jgi:hypothetical protein
MKKRDLLLAGLSLFSVSAFAQLGPHGESEPVRYDDDAKMIFIQDFEGSADWDTIKLRYDAKHQTTLYTWDTEPVDSITQMTYYKRNYKGGETDNPSGGTNIYDRTNKQWEIAGVRDTLMYLYNGVLRTDAEHPEDSILKYDKQRIVVHGSIDDSQHGLNDMGLDRFGEDGGNQYFEYESAYGKGLINNAWSDGKVAEYRRNLFVRLTPGTITDNGSYRVTVFVRAKSTAVDPANKIDPTIGLQLMRGYFHSEKPFMAQPTVKVSSNWWGTSVTSYEFNDKVDYKLYPVVDEKQDPEYMWEKITLMAYYMNDSIGDASAYLLSYYWHDDWDWNVQVDDDGNVLPKGEEGNAATLKFIKQPDKYFVRMAFRSDSTIFDVDNLSLTKSWIGGVEHWRDMIRVDFGYKTNMKDLAIAARDKNNIDAVELPGQYFDVWAHYLDPFTGDSVWEYIPINSAEYHGDGYMYMWTKPYEEDNSMRQFYPGDEVLVTFRNPIDNDSLRLFYNTDIYPNGLDEEWIKNGKNVFDFHNEISSYNPTIAVSNGKTVLSLKNLPPVLQKLPHPEGTFGLHDTDSLVFYFSRKVYSANTGDDNTDYTFVTVTGANGIPEYWTITSYYDGRTVITRPQSYIDTYGPLAGDYLIHFDLVTHLEDADITNNDHYGDDVDLNLHFGEFSANPEVKIFAESDWRNKVTGTNRPYPTNIYVHSEATGETFRIGDGKNTSGKCGLYQVGTGNDCLFYLAGRADAGKFGNLYTTPISLEAGVCNISFKAVGWGTDDLTTTLYVYAKPSETITEENGYALLNGITNKTVVGKFKAGKNITSMDSSKDWPDGTPVYSFNFSVPSDGEYILEWAVPSMSSGGNNYFGVAIGNFTIQNVGNLSFDPVVNLNKAIAAADEKITAATNNSQYQGAAFEAVQRVRAHGAGYIAATIAANAAPAEDQGHLQKAYADEAQMINDTVKAMQLQMDTVDAFFKARADAQTKLDIYSDSLVAYFGLAAREDLQTLVSGFSTYDCSTKAPGVIAADTKKLTDAMKALDDRKALNDKLDAAFAEAEAFRDSTEIITAYGSTDEYEDLCDLIFDLSVVDPIEATDAEINDMISALAEAEKAILLSEYYQDLKPYLAGVATKRIELLDSLATALGVVFDADMLGRIASVDTDDDDLADDMKDAITEAIYNRANDGNKNPVDLTGFIKNYYLYATPRVVDRSDKNMPENKDDLGADPGFAQIQKVQHQYNKVPIWIMILKQEFNDLYPGWTVIAKDNGNCMVSLEAQGANNAQMSENPPVFDAQISMDWNGRAEMKSIVEGLPVGTYSLSVDLMQNGNASNTTLEATVGGKSYKATAASDAKSLTVDGINVVDPEDGTMLIDFNLASGNNWSEADNFSLTFTPLAGFDYSQVATVIDLAQVESDGEYEYYTLTWIKVEYPEKNQVYFRKSGNVVEKIIFK